MKKYQVTFEIEGDVLGDDVALNIKNLKGAIMAEFDQETRDADHMGFHPRGVCNCRIRGLRVNPLESRRHCEELDQLAADFHFGEAEYVPDPSKRWAEIKATHLKKCDICTAGRGGK